MKRITALLCAVLLACLCFACGGKGPNPPPGPEKAVALLTLYADTQPLRIVTQAQGVKVTLQQLEYEPTVGFLRPIADVWEEALTPGKDYEIDAELAETVPQYRLLIQQGENIAVHNLAYDGRDGKTVFEIAGKPWVPAPIDGNSPMVHLARAAVVVPPGDDLYTYWYAIANAVATLRSVDLELEPDELDGEGSWYRVPEWLFEAYALALFPGMDVPPLGDYDLWVTYHPETYERYWVGLAYSTWLWAEYKRAQRNSDGTWDVTFALSAEDDDETVDRVVRLAPNRAYNPDSPFEYHIVGWPAWPGYEDDGPPIPAVPPPEIVVGTWTGPVKRGHVAWLEIYPDGMAGLYLGDDESDQLYETYHGAVAPTDDVDIEGSGVDYVMDMDFRLDWYIYESGDGTPVTGVPGAYSGIYSLRQEWEGDQQVLYVKTLEGDNLYGKKELKMLWVPKTEGGGSMVDIEAMG